MAKWRMSEEEFERQYAEAVRRGKEKTKTEPQARSVSYDRDANRLTIEFKNGATFTVPCNLLPEFAGVDPDLIAEVELRPRGAALHWKNLNQDFSIAGLMGSIFNTDALMSEMGRRGGSVSSAAKAAAARANGQRGGRPAKSSSIEGERFQASLVYQLGFILGDIAQLEPPGIEAPFEEIVEAEEILNNADRFALKRTEEAQFIKSLLVNGTEPIVSEGTIDTKPASDFTVRNHSRGNEENENENLALAA